MSRNVYHLGFAHERSLRDHVRSSGGFFLGWSTLHYMLDDKDEAQVRLDALPVKAGQNYRHFTGGEYEIIAVGLQEDTLKPLVIYRSLAKDTVWVRTAENFLETVEREGKTFQRFNLIE